MTPAAERRALLVAAANPAPRLDYLVTLLGRVGDVAVRLRLVPDRLILDPASFGPYLAALGGAEPLEALGATVLEDSADRLVPRWVEVAVRGPLHQALFEDRQPKWEGKALLERADRLPGDWHVGC
ncbi:MAG: hypothetical protein HQL38_17580 [Alphaproteobacteria bacterium]|nr:hypothetical protein [Alphaproteobacteria bacterium]